MQEQDAAFVADDLLKKWDRGELSEKDQDIAAQFLVHAGLLKTLQNQITKQLSKDQSIPWVALIQMILKVKKNIPDNIVDPIFVGMTELNQLENIIYIQAAKDLHPRFNSVITTLISEKIKALKEEKTQLKQKLQRHINDRMDTEVLNVSTLLREKFPTDKEILDMTSDIDMARIRGLLQKKERQYQEDFNPKKEKPDSKEIKELAQDVIRNAKKNPTTAYDLSILLAQMEIYEAAIECLDYAKPSFEKDWLKLDLLIQSENYIDAINESFEIEKKYFHKPETIFATLELRAKALYGLGEKDKAMQILEKIAENNPKNQTVKVLLKNWRSN